MARIYLDNAATSWPKPEACTRPSIATSARWAPPHGRSGYAEAIEAGRIVERARRGVAQLLGAAEPRQVVFTYSGTDSLNTGHPRSGPPGDHVVTTVCEHNSVLRPLRALADEGGVEVTYVPCDGAGFVSPEDVQAALRPNTRLVAVVHASNVTGAIQPIAEIGAAVAEHDALFLVDAAQSLGHEPVDVEASHIDLLAAPGHKGLLGPLGVGLLYLRHGVERELAPLRAGGTGTQSDEDSQPQTMPHKFEAGNHNMPGLAGLAAAMDELKSHTIEKIAAHHREVISRLIGKTSRDRWVDALRPGRPMDRARAWSASTWRGMIRRSSPRMLDTSHGVQCRAGLHCAPRMHEALGTTASGGTVRLSPGLFTTDEEIDAAVEAIQEAASVAIR